MKTKTFKKDKRKRGKKGIVPSTIAIWLLALIALVLIIGMILFLKGKLEVLGEMLKAIFGR